MQKYRAAPENLPILRPVRAVLDYNTKIRPRQTPAPKYIFTPFSNPRMNANSPAKSLWQLFCQTFTVLAAAALVWQFFARAPADSYHNALAQVLTSVVGVYGRNAPDLADINASDSIGAGVIVDGRHILTNYHIVANMGFIEADINGKRRAAEVVGVAPEIDIAVLRVSGDLLPPIAFAEDASLKQGDVVFAVGNPFGLSRSVSMGVVSAIGRRGLGMNILENYIQTDAAFNPGSSGGALTNAKGELVGINTALFSRYSAQGIGFAVPSEVVRRSLGDFLPSASALPEGNHIGAEVRPMSQRLHMKVLGYTPEHTPVMLVSKVWKGTPAEKMDLRPGDVILEIDETPPRTLSETGKLPPSMQSIEILRAGKRLHLLLPPPAPENTNLPENASKNNAPDDDSEK